MATRSTGSDRKPFCLWQIPGRKRIAHIGSDLILTAHVGVQWLRIAIDDELADGAAFRCTVPLGDGLRSQLARFHAESRLLEGEPAPPRARGTTRASLLHLRALQAIDAARGGASHRDIAAAIFGADDAHRRWTADSELRAQIRHLLSRAEALMRGGYLALAGVRRHHTDAPGDEPGD